MNFVKCHFQATAPYPTLGYRPRIRIISTTLRAGYAFREFGMGTVVQFRRPLASAAVIAKLVELGYLRHGKRHKAAAIEHAIARLKEHLHRDGIICGGEALRSLPGVADEVSGERP